VGWTGGSCCWGWFTGRIHAWCLHSFAAAAATPSPRPQLHSPPLTLPNPPSASLHVPPLLAAVQVTQIMVPLLKFYFNEEVRASAAQVSGSSVPGCSHGSALLCPWARSRPATGASA
jgi:hypothetical protein